MDNRNDEVEPTCYIHCKEDCAVACPEGDCEWAATCGDTKYCVTWWNNSERLRFTVPG